MVLLVVVVVVLAVCSAREAGCEAMGQIDLAASLVGDIDPARHTHRVKVDQSAIEHDGNIDRRGIVVNHQRRRRSIAAGGRVASNHRAYGPAHLEKRMDLCIGRIDGQIGHVDGP